MNRLFIALKKIINASMGEPHFFIDDCQLGNTLFHL